jgi:hypothetical protein
LREKRWNKSVGEWTYLMVGKSFPPRTLQVGQRREEIARESPGSPPVGEREREIDVGVKGYSR